MRVNAFKIGVGFWFGLAVFGQTPSLPTSQNKGQAQPEIPALIRQYNFGAQVEALNDMEILDPSLQSEPITPQFASSGAKNEGAAKPSSAPEISLSPTALAAVRVSEKWRGEPNQPAAGPDGRVLYSFGAGLPTVVCAPSPRLHY